MTVIFLDFRAKTQIVRSSLKYRQARILSTLARPFIGRRASLAGVWPSTVDFCRITGRQIEMIDNSQLIDYSLEPQFDLGSPSDANSNEHCEAPATFVAAIDGARTLFDYGVVVAPDQRLLGDVSPNMGGGYNKHALEALVLPKVQPIKGVAALLSSHAHQRYFHWMFDILPRFELLRASKIRPEIIIVNCSVPYQAETLKAVGIEQIIVSPSLDSHLAPETLIVPSLPGPIGYPTRRSCDFLRQTLLRSRLATPPHRALYVSRIDAKTRRVTNEAEVVGLLRRWGFELVHLEGETVARQAELFSEACIVVAPHGAGLTNLVFCQPGAVAIEFMPEKYRNFCFRRLCSVQGLRYGCINARSCGSEHDMWVDIRSLELMLSSIWSRKSSIESTDV